ncbi:hypothetical protein ACFPZK_11745 [Psychrobacter urativorans]|nr:hypothetical protein [Psychrobacter urativorans]
MKKFSELALEPFFGPQSAAEMSQLSNKDLNALDNEFAKVKSNVETL